MAVTERIERLKKLSNAHGVSGFEVDIQKEVAAQLPSNVVIQYDSIGNLIAHCKGKSSFPNVLIEAHADEIGFLTTYITEDGFIKFRAIGAWPSNELLGQRVVIRSGEKSITGIIGTVPPHVSHIAAEQKDSIAGMFIDCLLYTSDAADEEDSVDLG